MDQDTTNSLTPERWILSRGKHGYNKYIALFFFIYALILLTLQQWEWILGSIFLTCISLFIWKTQGKNYTVSYDPVGELIRIRDRKREIILPLADVVSIWEGNRVCYKESHDIHPGKYYTPFAITFRRSTKFGKEISFTVFEEDPSDMKNVRKFKDKVILKRHAQAMAYGQKVREQRGS